MSSEFGPAHTHCSLLIAHCSLLIAHFSLLLSPYARQEERSFVPARKSCISKLQSEHMSPAVAPTPNAFIRQLPKAELHLHLEGAVEPSTLLELRNRHGDTATLAETEALYRYSDFPSFLMAFKDVSAHLRGPDDYELITYRLMQRLKEENVLHAEVYVAVGVCLFRKQDFAAIFEGLELGRARGAHAACAPRSLGRPRTVARAAWCTSRVAGVRSPCTSRAARYRKRCRPRERNYHR